MFEQIDSLPGSQSEPALDDRNGNVSGGQCSANMSRHVVGALLRVPVPPRLLRGQAFKKRLEIRADVRGRVFLNQQSGRGVPAKQGQEAGLHSAGLKPIEDVTGHLDEPAAAGGNSKSIDELAHGVARAPPPVWGHDRIGPARRPTRLRGRWQLRRRPRTKYARPDDFIGLLALLRNFGALWPDVICKLPDVAGRYRSGRCKRHGPIRRTEGQGPARTGPFRSAPRQGRKTGQNSAMRSESFRTAWVSPCLRGAEGGPSIDERRSLMRPPGYRRQITPNRNPSPRASATAESGRSRTTSSSESPSEEACDRATPATTPSRSDASAAAAPTLARA